MKAVKLLFSFLVFPIFIQAQAPPENIDDIVYYDQRALDKFYETTTYIVLDQFKDSEYSKKITEAVKEVWTITPFEVIDQATYNEYIKDKYKSFLTREYIAGDEELISLSLFMGGQRYMEKKGRLIANTKLKHYTATDEDFLYKLPVLLQNMQWRINMIQTLKFTSELDFQDYYLKNNKKLHSKKLFILNEHLTNKVESLERLKKYYKYDVRLVTKDIIADAILTKDSTVAFLSIVAPTKNYGGATGFFRIFTTDTGESLRSYERSVSNSAPPGVIGYDLKSFND